MNRSKTLQAINGLPVTDAVKAQARRFLEELPAWVPEPKVFDWIDGACVFHWEGFIHHPVLPQRKTLDVHVYNDRGAPLFACFVTMGLRTFDKKTITDRDVHELLRQFTGMVALTGGG
jgi:hypothetical protein